MSRINPTLDKNLSSYALVAGVTGAGVLALALPAEGKVVFTATHQLLGPYMRVYLDLNNDGFDDFFFYNFNFATHISYPGSYGSVEVTGLHAANDVIVTSGPKFFAEAFGSGVEVSSKANFRSGQNLMNFCRTNPIHHTRFRSGPWINVKDRFLGLEFTVQGQIHYGWVVAQFETEDAIGPRGDQGQDQELTLLLALKFSLTYAVAESYPVL